jgi:secreted PhoX family phosphatase
MPDLPDVSRRRALRYLTAAPMLPLGSTACAALLSACTSEPMSRETVAYVSTSFASMPAPTDIAARATTTVGSAMNVHLSDGSTQRYALSYQPFFMTGQTVPRQGGGTIVAGAYYDSRNRPIVDDSASGRQFFSDCPDGTSLLQLPDAAIDGIKGKPVFAVVQFEYTSRDEAGADAYGTLPSPIAVLTLDQDQQTGKLSLVQYHNVDTSKVHGLWITCGASLSPWNTHLSSEEYEPDAQFIDEVPWFAAFSTHTFGAAHIANPYHYGHVPEVTVHPDGSGTIKKHYCLGRISHELIQVMPDQRTVLMGDDYTNGGLFMFIADRAQDLSSGTLYVAQFGAGFSLDPATPGAALRWIRLGHASSDEIETMADSFKPGDIMSAFRADPNDPSYTKMYVDGKANWIKLKPGMEKAAAFLETHRYANLVGASMAFTKMEGTTVNARDKIAYSALQNIQTSMVQGHRAWRASANVTVPQALVAGGILAHDLSGGQRDTDDQKIDSEWVPARTRALLLGEDIPADAMGNKANPERIGNPDNLKFSEKMRTLFIGEDSSTHVNNFLWAYNVDTKQLSRLMSLPAGAESTGLHAVDELNGWTYIMSNFQHPGEKVASRGALKAQIDTNYRGGYSAAVGYLTADPLQPRL